ncbi:hypothetical protein EV715DRAFT_277783 [Schizophyllum commune]
MTSYAGETAVALLIEASAPIVNTWSSIAPLLPAILQRAAQCKPGNRLRVGVILYGPSHTPLLLNLFFTAPSAMQEILRLAYESGPLAKRRPAVTGKDPVAVLDALVAALDMFDTLTSVPNQKPVWKQVLHMAAVQPDDARHSTTCVRPELDGMGWEGLVQAFKEREINYSTVRCGKSPLGALGEFQKKLATDTIKPWLSYDSSLLTLHISASLTAPARPHPVPTTSNKRPAESAPNDKSDAGGDGFVDAIEYERESTHSTEPVVDAYALQHESSERECIQSVVDAYAIEREPGCPEREPDVIEREPGCPEREPDVTECEPDAI